jgi:hypothetical protein
LRRRIYLNQVEGPNFAGTLRQKKIGEKASTKSGLLFLSKSMKRAGLYRPQANRKTPGRRANHARVEQPRRLETPRAKYFNRCAVN